MNSLLPAGRLPWYVKIPAKIVLSRLPVSRDTWHRLGLFVTGPMDRPEHAVGVFTKHCRNAGPVDTHRPYTVLEIGPGRSLLTALIAWSNGADRTYLIDVDDLADHDAHLYIDAAAALAREGKRVPDRQALEDVQQMIRAVNGVYMTGGTSSFQLIMDNSVDLSFSHAVLEHVDRQEVPQLFAELYRVMKPGSRSSHVVDFQDHLEQNLHNLRFSGAVWEAPLMKASGFYTNRWRASDIITMAKAAGFHVTVTGKQMWETLPLDRRWLHPHFRSYSDDDLLTRGIDVVFTKPCPTDAEGD